MIKSNKCSKCACHLKEIAGLKRIFINADDESVRRCIKYENKILELRAEIKQLKAERSSHSQNKKKVLARVGGPDSNTTLCAPNPFKH